MTTSRSRAHTHPCTHCRTPVECHGTWEQNYDGFPEVICGFYHLPNGSLAELYCDACWECQDCGETATLDWYGKRVCSDCYTRLDNYDGPEPDYDTPTLRETYERAWDEKRRLG